MQMTIIGCGNMGSGLAEHLSHTTQLCFYDHHIEKAEKLEQEGYGKAYKDIKNAIEHSKFIILAIKPQSLKKVSLLIEKELKKEQIVVSLLAGIPIKVLEQCFPNITTVRMMPNLALIYG